MNIFLARHGETAANRRGIILGRGDSPLTEAGLERSGRLAAGMNCEGIGAIWSSPLGRAVRTAEIFAAATGWPLTVTDGLAELSCGDWEGCARNSVLRPGRPLRSSWDDAPGGGESAATAATRLAEVVQRLREAPADNILVVGHAAVNQVFLQIWLSLAPREALTVRHPHDLLYRIEDVRVSWVDSAGAGGTGLRLQP